MRILILISIIFLYSCQKIPEENIYHPPKGNNELQNISQWLYINKLILNVNKTNYMIFTNKHIIIDDIEVKIINIKIDNKQHKLI